MRKLVTLKRKILIIRLSAIGDIVWTTPVIRTIKQQIPNIELHYCTKLQYAEMVDSNPYIDQYFYLKDDLRTLVKELQQHQYEYIIDLHKNLRTFWIKRYVKGKVLTYYKYTFQRFLFVNFKIRFSFRHVADRYLDAIAPLKVKYDGKGLDYFIEKKYQVDKSVFPEIFQKEYTAFVIGASEFTKKLPLSKLIELCKKINAPIVLVGGKEDMPKSSEIVKHFECQPFSNVQIYNACGKYSISQSASIIQQAKRVFGHDTGLTHIAAAFHKKIYIIYGGTSSIGFYPYECEHVLIENNHLKCRPCSKSGRSSCPLGHFECMNELKFDFEITD